MMNDPQIIEQTTTVRADHIRCQMNLIGTPEAIALEQELGEIMPDWIAEKIAKKIIALVELTTVRPV